MLHNSAHLVHVAEVLRLKLSLLYDNDVRNSCTCNKRTLDNSQTHKSWDDQWEPSIISLRKIWNVCQEKWKFAMSMKLIFVALLINMLYGFLWIRSINKMQLITRGVVFYWQRSSCVHMINQIVVLWAITYSSGKFIELSFTIYLLNLQDV